MTHLSPRLTIREFTFSQTAARLGINNSMNAYHYGNARRFAEHVYERVCDILGYEPTLSSGFRCEALNAVLPGASKTSLHKEALAGDFDPPPDKSVREVFDKLRASDIPYEEIILECDSWVHVALAMPGKVPNRQQLVMWRDGKQWRRRPAAPLPSTQADGAAA